MPIGAGPQGGSLRPLVIPSQVAVGGSNSEARMMDADEIMHGLPGRTYRGLLGTWPPELMPPETMTRQRRRAQERAERKQR